jgi:hypothetical protein
MRNLTQVSALPVGEDEDAALRACSNFWREEYVPLYLTGFQFRP